MTYTAALQQDQERIEVECCGTESSVPQTLAQDTIATIYRINGESDGYQGIYPQSNDYEYLSGYAMGVYRYRASEISKINGETVAPF